MTHITRLESKHQDLAHGGLWIHFDSGRDKLVQWRSGAPVRETMPAAEDLVTRVIDALMKDGAAQEVRDTNWVSVTAAVERCLAEWNVRLLESLLKEGVAGGGESVH